MQRFPATTWTGDPQDCSHETMLRFSMYGQPYHECDMTSEDPTNLVRQYQNAVFSPLMRVHQMHGTPRFPYNYCNGKAGSGGGSFNGAGNHSGPEHCVAFHQALRLRYSFIPYVYSLAHHARKYLRPIAVPAVFEFPELRSSPQARSDEWSCAVRSNGGYDTSCRNSSWHSYMFGSQILVSDVIIPGGKKVDQRPFDNVSVVDLPPGTWYRLGSSQTVHGNRTIRELINVTTHPVFVRQGSVLPLNKQHVQYSEEQGGTLEVQVYAGADGSFELFEDDGATLDYQTSEASVRTTNFSWTNGSQTLSWVASGPHPASGVAYTHMDVVLFGASAGLPRARKEGVLIGRSGTVKFAASLVS